MTDIEAVGKLGPMGYFCNRSCKGYETEEGDKL